MKKNINKIFLIFSLILVVFLVLTVIPAYITQHQYYLDMFGKFKHWSIIGLSLLFSMIPIGYLLFSRQRKIYVFLIALFLGLFFFGVGFLQIKAGIINSGAVMWFINSFLVFVLSVVFLISILSFGVFLKSKLLKLGNETIFDVLLSFGIGLATFTVINYIFILIGVFYSVVSWLFFLFLMSCVYFVRDHLIEINKIIQSIFEKFNIEKIKSNKILVFGVILLLFSVVYYYFGFLNSFIPYPTAWDANHAYMFYPKMWAHNNGFFWGVEAMFKNPYVWLGYIAFWFNLFVPFEGFWISPATFAVEMNFLSGIFVLLIGIGLIREVISLVGGMFNLGEEEEVNSENVSVSKEKISEYTDKEGDYGKLEQLYSQEKSGKEENQLLSLYVGRFLLLLWLTSGMGAFLVFVDNKTDLGVLTMIMLALYSGFVFLSKMRFSEGNEKTPFVYICISGFMFAVAVLSKPTAFFDVVNFGLFLVFLWMGVIGVLGIYLLVVGLLSYMKFRNIGSYFSPAIGKPLMLIGALLGGGEIIKTFIAKQLRALKYILIWGGIFALSLLLLKGPFELAKIVVKEQQFNPVEFSKNVFLGKAVESGKKPSKYKNSDYPEDLLASVSNRVLYSAKNNDNNSVGNNGEEKKCTMDSQGFSSQEQLYKDTEKAKGGGQKEDVGRYVGYGWKNFKDPFWSFLFPGSNYCVSNDESAKILCENSDVITEFKLKEMPSVLSKIPENSKGYRLLSGIINSGSLAEENVSEVEVDENLLGEYEENISDIKSFYRENAIKVRKRCVAHPDTSIQEDCVKYNNKDLPSGKVRYGKDVSIPFKYLIPFNITFNWSLQNESSYYTDIGYIWLFLLFFLPVGLIYGAVRYDRFLVSLSAVTILGWSIWFFIAGAILWYGIGLIIWTILAFVVFVYRLFRGNREFFFRFIALFFVICFIQLFMNLIRISSQGGSSAFIWYKQSSGKITSLDKNLEVKETQKVPYSWRDIFNKQFPHYKKFVNLANKREKGERIFLAGTYSRYFIKDQFGIKYDQLLMSLWELFSDSNVCNSYLRLKDKGYKYITIDPNIGTVVMGEGNESLFDRFFGNINRVEGTVEKDGVITMLVKLTRNNYIKYVSSNNLGAKYAFVLEDETIRNYFDQKMEDSDINILRASMAAARYPRVQKLVKDYFDGNRQGIIRFIINMAYQRIQNGEFIGDIADMRGYVVDESKLEKIASNFMEINNLSSRQKQRQKRNEIKEKMKNLSKEERMVLSQYLSISRLYNKGDQRKLNQTMQKMIMQSLSSSSQIITLEVKE